MNACEKKKKTPDIAQYSFPSSRAQHFLFFFFRTSNSGCHSFIYGLVPFNGPKHSNMHADGILTNDHGPFKMPLYRFVDVAHSISTEQKTKKKKSEVTKFYGSQSTQMLLFRVGGNCKTYVKRKIISVFFFLQWPRPESSKEKSPYHRVS